jgi:hypothetical protein
LVNDGNYLTEGVFGVKFFYFPQKNQNTGGVRKMKFFLTPPTAFQVITDDE